MPDFAEQTSGSLIIVLRKHSALVQEAGAQINRPPPSSLRDLERSRQALVFSAAHGHRRRICEQPLWRDGELPAYNRGHASTEMLSLLVCNAKFSRWERMLESRSGSDWGDL
jgi:hypothetical protein